MKQILRGFPGHLQDKLGKDQVDYLMLNLPPICNYKCKICSTKARSRNVKNPLTNQEIYDLIDESKNLGAKVVGLTGEGEPLLNKSIRDIVKHIHDNDMMTIMATNGSMLDKDTAKYLAEHNVTVVVSLDSVDEKVYEEQSGVKGSYKKVMKNLSDAREVYRDLIDGNVKSLAAHMIINSETIHGLNKVKEYCGDDILFSCDYVAEVGDALKNKDLSENVEMLKKAAESDKIVMAKANGKDVCGLFYYGIGIGYAGDILLDAHAVDSEGKLGNIRNLPLNEAIEKVKKHKERFSCYCVVRDPKYQEIVKNL